MRAKTVYDPFWLPTDGWLQYMTSKWGEPAMISAAPVKIHGGRLRQHAVWLINDENNGIHVDHYFDKWEVKCWSTGLKLEDGSHCNRSRYRSLTAIQPETPEPTRIAEMLIFVGLLP